MMRVFKKIKVIVCTVVVHKLNPSQDATMVFTYLELNVLAVNILTYKFSC